MIVNFTTYSDSGFTQDFVYQTAAFVAISLVNIELRMHVRAHAADATVFIALSNLDGADSGIIVTNAALGRFTVQIPYETLTRLPVGSYEHSLIGTDLLDVRFDLWRGTLDHFAGPTRWGST